MELPSIKWLDGARAIFIFALALSACAAPAPVTPTKSTPGMSAALPSSTPVPIPMPLFTPTPANSPTPLSPLAAAFAKTQAAQKYRVTMLLDVQSPGAPAFALDLKGEVNGADARTAYQLGGESIELIAARGQFFVKGARGLGMPTMTTWYSLTPDLADAAQPPFAPMDLLNDFVAQTAHLAFQMTGREPLDGQPCAVWRATPRAPAETGIGDVVGAGHTDSAFGALDRAEIKVWVCADGAAHQVSAEIAAHNANTPADKSTAKWTLHVWALDEAGIKIDAPANAVPFRLVEPTR